MFSGQEKYKIRVSAQLHIIASILKKEGKRPFLSLKCILFGQNRLNIRVELNHFGGLLHFSEIGHRRH